VASATIGADVMAHLDEKSRVQEFWEAEPWGGAPRRPPAGAPGV
jgi:hypothetical protein